MYFLDLFTPETWLGFGEHERLLVASASAKRKWLSVFRRMISSSAT